MTGAKTLTLDGKTGNVYLIAAEYGPAPAPPTDAPAPAAGPTSAGTPDGGPGGGGRRRRAPMLPGSFTILEVGK
jgi:hypothetical protein